MSPLDRFERHFIGMVLTIVIIGVTLTVCGALERGGGAGENPRQGALGDTAAPSTQPSLTPKHSEVVAMAEQAAYYLERGELVLALSPIALRDHGYCAWDLNTGFIFPNDIDRPYARHRVRREAAIAGVMVAFGRHGDTTVFVTVRCP